MKFPKTENFTVSIHGNLDPEKNFLRKLTAFVLLQLFK